VLFADRAERGASVNELNDIHSCRAFVVLYLDFGVPLLCEQREHFIQSPRKQRENERTFFPFVVQKCKQTKNGEQFQPDGRLDTDLDFKECMAESQSLTRIGDRGSPTEQRE
jgi:hypothetical protein